MKLKIIIIILALFALIDSASAGNVAPATAVVYDTSGNGKTGCGDTLNLTFHTSSPWKLYVNDVEIMTGAGPDNASVEAIPLENTWKNVEISPSNNFGCAMGDANIVSINSSDPQDGYSIFNLVFTAPPGVEFPDDAWEHVDPPEPPVPEASTIVLVGLGIAGLAGIWLKKR